jgi:hypothetical protein
VVHDEFPVVGSALCGVSMYMVERTDGSSNAKHNAPPLL